jgi:hypothetical protein
VSRLSVVVTIVDGGATLDRCLSALNEQIGGPELEVIVPWDDSVPGMAELERRFPRFRFLALGRLDTVRPKPSPAGQHELFDRRSRGAGKIAGGELIAILEDRGCRARTGLHGSPNCTRTLACRDWWAIQNGRIGCSIGLYFCDFGRYSFPLRQGRGPLSDVNMLQAPRAWRRLGSFGHRAITKPPSMGVATSRRGTRGSIRPSPWTRCGME